VRLLVLMTSTEDAFVKTAGATIRDSTANGFTDGSMQTFSPKEPRTRRHVPGRPPHTVGDGHAMASCLPPESSTAGQPHPLRIALALPRCAVRVCYTQAPTHLVQRPPHVGLLLQAT
jgi:hypothetical protein